MGPIEVWVGWIVFFSLLVVSAALGISGRLRLGEAVTGGMLAVAAGLGTGGLVDSLRNAAAGPLRYAVPMLVLAVGGYTWLTVAVWKGRARAAPAREQPRSIVTGYAVIAATAITTIIAVFAAQAIARRGAPIWVAPALTGLTTFASGTLIMDRRRRRERIRRGVAPVPAVVRSRTAIAVVLGSATAVFYASMSVLAVLPLVALPFTLSFMWRAARDASVGGRLLISVLVAPDLLPIGAFLTHAALGRRGSTVLYGGSVIAVLCAILFWVRAQGSAARARRPA